MNISLSKRTLFYLSAFIFSLMFMAGLLVAVNKYFWADEVHYLNHINSFSYLDMILGMCKVDPSRFPLFHLVEKTYVNFLHLFNIRWPGILEATSYANLPLQVWYRIPPIVFISLAVAFSFYFYSRYFGVALGVLNLIASISTYMLWAHIAENRQYALWFLITTVQLAYLFIIIDKKSIDKKYWFWLMFSQFLLVFHTAFSVFQILAAGMVLWIFNFRQKKSLYIMTLLQGGIWFYYYNQCWQQYFYFTPESGPLNVAAANFPLDRILIWVIFVLILAWAYFSSFAREKYLALSQELKRGAPVALFCFFMFIAAVIEIIKFHTMKPLNAPRFEVSNRYFIYLAPLSILISSFVPYIVGRAFRSNRMWFIIFAVLFGTLFLFRFYKTWAYLFT